jgi:hypothetical protein
VVVDETVTNDNTTTTTTTTNNNHNVDEGISLQSTHTEDDEEDGSDSSYSTSTDEDDEDDDDDEEGSSEDEDSETSYEDDEDEETDDEENEDTSYIADSRGGGSMTTMTTNDSGSRTNRNYLQTQQQQEGGTSDESRRRRRRWMQHLRNSQSSEEAAGVPSNTATSYNYTTTTDVSHYDTDYTNTTNAHTLTSHEGEYGTEEEDDDEQELTANTNTTNRSWRRKSTRSALLDAGSSDTTDPTRTTSIRSSSVASKSNSSFSGSSPNQNEQQIQTLSPYNISTYSSQNNDVNSVMTTPRHTNSPLKTKDRVPGGAAAKIMLVGPKESSEELSSVPSMDVAPSSDSQTLLVQQQQELTKSLQTDYETAKQTFFRQTNTTKPRIQTYIMTTETTNEQQCEQYEVIEDDVEAAETATNASTTITTPSFLNRQEIFHKSAKDSITALLSPGSFGSHAESTPNSEPANNNHNNNSHSFEQLQHLLDAETQRQLEDMNLKMVNPTDTLMDLLTAIATPDETTATPDEIKNAEWWLAYSVRRKNACGALQTLTANPRNQVRIAWTAGVLPALTSVLTEGLRSQRLSPYDAHIEDTEQRQRIQTEYHAARNRSISALMNLSMPVKNRIAVFHSPGLVRALLDTIETDTGVARRGCCAVLAFLAKTPENRLLLAHVPGLFPVVRNIIQPSSTPNNLISATKKKSKKRYPWSSTDDDEASSSSHSSSGSHTEGKSPKTPTSHGTSFSSVVVTSTTTSDYGSPSSEAGMSTSPTGTTDDKEGEGTAQSSKNQSSPTDVTTAENGNQGYDQTADAELQGARQNLFAMLGHLVKEKDNALLIGRDLPLVETLIEVAKHHEASSHALSLKCLAHLTRHRQNKTLAFKPKCFVPTLVSALSSPSSDARLFACYGLQNLSQEKSCRQELALTERLIESLCELCRNTNSQENERLAAISTLKNLCDEPANLIPMTNTAGCVSTMSKWKIKIGWDEQRIGLLRMKKELLTVSCSFFF